MEGFSNYWHCYNECHTTTDTNIIQLDAVLANRSEDDDMYPLTMQKLQMLKRLMQH